MTPNKRLLTLLGLSLAGAGLYSFRRRLIAGLLDLPRGQYAVGIEPNIPIPMRDNVRLMADHYYPKTGSRFPTILIRSIYGRGSDIGSIFGLIAYFFAARFAEHGFHVIIQTTRGRFDSEGKIEPFIDATPDGQATLDWLDKQPWFDGNLGTWGPSYLGYVQWAIAAYAPPILKAVLPIATTSQFNSVIHRNGAFALDLLLRWIYLTEKINSDGKQSSWQILRTVNPSHMTQQLEPAFQHLPLIETDQIALGYPVSYYRNWIFNFDPDDPRWQAIDHSPGLARVAAPAHFVSGWYDILLPELLNDYATLQAAGRRPYLTIGPWRHLDIPLFLEGLRQGLFWFEAHLKGNQHHLRKKPVRIYVMGANEWREMDEWPPPAQERRYFLQDGRRLAPDPPSPDSPPDHYRYNPADPTPSVGGALLLPPFGPVDNRNLEARPDVLIYTTPPLTRDLEIIGPVRLELFVKSSLEHTDFFGRVCDVRPNGRSINICDGLFRVEPHKGEKQDDGSRRIIVEMWPTAHRFQRGHRLRLQVSSGAHPRWSRNLGAGAPLGRGTVMLAAEQTIYHDSTHPSALVLPKIKA